MLIAKTEPLGCPGKGRDQINVSQLGGGYTKNITYTSLSFGGFEKNIKLNKLVAISQLVVSICFSTQYTVDVIN